MAYAKMTGGQLVTRIPSIIGKGDVIFCLLSDFDNHFNDVSEKDIHIFAINTESFIAHRDQNSKIDRLLILTTNPVTILDYQYNNIVFLRKNRPYIRVKYLPFTGNNYLRELFNPVQSSSKDIDVLFYGTLNDRRKKILDQLGTFCNVKHVFFDDIREQNSWIKRSKIVLNTYFYENNKVFDYCRLSYLLTNSIFVISELPEDVNVKYEKKLVNFSDYIITVKYDNIVDTVRLFLTKDEQERQTYAKKACDWFNKVFNMERDISHLITQLKIRKLSIGDYDSYLTLVKQLSKFDYDTDREKFSNYLDRDNVYIFVLPVESGLLACASLFIIEKIHTNPVAQIEDVVVDKNVRNNGYGKVMIDYIINYVKENTKCYKIVLNSNEDNLKFYQKCDFENIAYQCKYIE